MALPQGAQGQVLGEMTLAGVHPSPIVNPSRPTQSPDPDPGPPPLSLIVGGIH